MASVSLHRACGAWGSLHQEGALIALQPHSLDANSICILQAGVKVSDQVLCYIQLAHLCHTQPMHDRS